MLDLQHQVCKWMSGFHTIARILKASAELDNNFSVCSALEKGWRSIIPLRPSDILLLILFFLFQEKPEVIDLLNYK